MMNIEICKTIDDKEGFVGVKIENKKTKVYFPYGYPVRLLKGANDIVLKKEIRYLLYSLVGTKADAKLNSQSFLSDENSYLYDCIYLIEDFLDKGVYLEDEIISSFKSNGKINWKKTIKNQMPMIDMKNGKISGVLFNNTYRQKNIKKENIISLLELEALKIAKENIGFLYPDFYVKETGICDYKVYLPYLKNEISHVFTDTKKRIYESIINILDNKGKKDAPVSFKIGTYDYHIVWENMLRKVYGTIDEKKYFPETTYTLKTKNDNSLKRLVVSNMRPDLLFKPKDKSEYYIIDAKYYKYCETNNDSSTLPASESISKQIIYQQKIEEQLLSSGDLTRNFIMVNEPVHSMFILPYDKSNYDGEEFLPSSIKELAFKGFGSIEAKQSFDKTYIIALAFKDTKDLITEFNEGRKYHYFNQYTQLQIGYENYKNDFKKL